MGIQVRGLGGGGLFQIPVSNDADDLALLGHRHHIDFMLLEKLNGLGHGFFGIDGNDIFGHEISDQHLISSLGPTKGTFKPGDGSGPGGANSFAETASWSVPLVLITRHSAIKDILI